MANKKKGQNFETRVQKCINSGALYFDKGDLKTSEYLIECKHTDKKSFRLTTKIIQKIWDEALDSQKLPKIVIGIEDNNKTWIITCDIKKENK